MKRINVKKIGKVIPVCALAVLICSACESSQGDLEVRISDGQYETVTYAAAGETVQEILKNAEITLSADDVVTPEADTAIQSGDTSISIERCASVTLQDGDETQEVCLTGMKVSDALASTGITLGKNDTLNHSEDAYLTDGMQILVERRFGVNVDVDGKSEYLLTKAKTVQEMLEEQEIKLGEDDRISPALTDDLQDDLTIVINRVSFEMVTETESVPYSTSYENDSSMYSGETSVKQEGKNGEKEVTYKVTYVDGEEESREEVESKVTKDPVTRIVRQGTKQKQSSGSSSSGSSSSKKSSGSSSGSSSSGSSSSGSSGGSRQKVYDCDGSGHGYYIITNPDGSVTYEDF